jgi:hypothetical protein
MGENASAHCIRGCGHAGGEYSFFKVAVDVVLPLEMIGELLYSYGTTIMCQKFVANRYTTPKLNCLTVKNRPLFLSKYFLKIDFRVI